MAYMPLTQKYRPGILRQIVGQQPVVLTLTHAIETGRLVSAYLFTGPRGTGKTSMARILAKSLNCLASDGPTVEPCCDCAVCRTIATGDDVDVQEIDGASHNGVDAARKLAESASFRPMRSRYRIFIIDEAHMLTTQAFNALLKVLEEPPEHAKFILCTTEPNKIIATIRSRCQTYPFRLIIAQELQAHLAEIMLEEQVIYDESFAERLAEMAQGSMRDGVKLLDQAICTGYETLGEETLEELHGKPGKGKSCALLMAIGKGDPSKALERVGELLRRGFSERAIVESILGGLKDTLLERLAQMGSERVRRICDLVTELDELDQKLRRTDNATILLEASIVRMALERRMK